MFITTKKEKYRVIAMGIVKNTSSYFLVNKLNYFFTKLLTMFSNNFIFLSKSEHKKFKSKYPKNLDAHIYSILYRYNFWRSNNVNKDIDLLFIGNDGKRDYRFVEVLLIFY